MSVYMAPLEDDDKFKQKEDLGKCPKCGRVGCECDPETCDCEPQKPDRKDLIESFEE